MSDQDEAAQKKIVEYPISQADIKHAVKEAAKEMINEQVEEFGRWTLRCLLLAAFGGIIYLALKGQGWHK